MPVLETASVVLVIACHRLFQCGAGVFVLILGLPGNCTQHCERQGHSTFPASPCSDLGLVGLGNAQPNPAYLRVPWNMAI